MRLTEQHAKMFEALRKTDTGRLLVEYIELLEAEVCDVRNWTDKDTPESARQAAKVLREFRSHLTTDVGSKKATPSQYV